MRLNEITDQNKVWATLKGIDFDITTSIKEINNVLDLLISLKSPYRTGMFLPTIETMIEKIERFVDEDFPEQDLDIDNLKNYCKSSLPEIYNKKMMLP